MSSMPFLLSLTVTALSSVVIQTKGLVFRFEVPTHGRIFYFHLIISAIPLTFLFFDCAMAVAEGIAPKTVRAANASSPAKQLHCFCRGLESSSEQSR